MKMEYSNEKQMNGVLLSELSNILKFKKKDISDLLEFLEEIYINGGHFSIEGFNLFLLQYFLDNYLSKIESPYYTSILTAILGDHMVRICSNMLDAEGDCGSIMEAEVQENFDIDE